MRSAAPTPLPYPSELHQSGAGHRIDSVASTDSHSVNFPLHSNVHQQQQRHSSLSTSTQSTHHTQATHGTAASAGPLRSSSQDRTHAQKGRGGSAQTYRYKHDDDLSVTSAPVHPTASSSGQAGRLSSSQSVVAPSDVFERLAVRGRLKAHKTYNWDLPPPQVSYCASRF